MSAKRSKISNEKQPKVIGAHRRRAKYTCAGIVSLNLAKCVSHNLTDLLAKLEISGKQRKIELPEKEDPDAAKFATFREKGERSKSSAVMSKGKYRGITAKEISELASKNFRSVGKKFTKAFRHFSKLGDGKSNGKSISYSQTLRWLKRAEVLDNHRITIRDVEVHFINKLRKGHELKILDFIRFLKSLCEDRGLEMPTVIFKLLSCRNGTETIKKDNLARHRKTVDPEKKTLSPPKKKVSTLNATLKESKRNVTECDGGTFKATSKIAARPKAYQLSAECSRIKDKSNIAQKEDQGFLRHSIKISQLDLKVGWIHSNLQSDPFYYLHELDQTSSEEKLTCMADKVSVRNGCLKHDKGIRFKNALLFESKKDSTSLKEESDWITPALRSVPPLEDEKVDIKEKTVMLRSRRNFEKKPSSRNPKLSAGKKMKLGSKPNRSDTSASIELDVNHVEKKKRPLISEVFEINEETFEIQTKESYEYVSSENETGDHNSEVESGNQCCKHPGYPESKDSNKAKIKKGKISKATEKADKRLERRAKPSKIVSIMHLKKEMKTGEDVNQKGRSRSSKNKENKPLKEQKRTRSHPLSKNADSSKIKKYVERIFSEDLKLNIEENPENKETDNEEISPDLEKSRQAPDLQAPKTSKPKPKKLGGRKSIKRNTVQENIPHEIMPPLENKREKTRKTRTFTNLPVRRVKKVKKKKKSNNVPNAQNSSSKTIGSEDRKKVSSSTERTTPASCNDNVGRYKAESKTPISNAAENPSAGPSKSSEVESGTQISNAAENVSVGPSKSSEVENGDDSNMGEKIGKKYKIRKGVRLQKKELKDPETEIQNQEFTKPSNKM